MNEQLNRKRRQDWNETAGQTVVVKASEAEPTPAPLPPVVPHLDPNKALPQDFPALGILLDAGIKTAGHARLVFGLDAVTVEQIKAALK